MRIPDLFFKNFSTLVVKKQNASLDRFIDGAGRLVGSLGVSVVVAFLQARSHALLPALGRSAPCAALHESVLPLAVLAFASLLVSAAMLRGDPEVRRNRSSR